MADETTTPADTTPSTTDAPVDAAATEQQAAPDTQAVEAAQDGASPQTDGETSLLGGEVVEKAADDAEAAAAKAEPEHVVPEKYELAVEGLELDALAIEEATPVFKELNLSNEQASKLMPVAAQFRDRVTTQTLQQLAEQGAQQKAEWASSTKADPDIGGAKLDETLHLASKGLDHFGHTEGSDFRKLLTETGFGNHPEMVRMMRAVGEMLSEDGFARANAGSQAPSAKDILYPTSKGA